MRDRSQARTSYPITLSLAALLAACGGSDSAPETLSPGPNEILVGNALNFTPAHLTVPLGTTVRWRNVGPYDHTVTSGLSSKPAGSPGTEFDDSFRSGTTFDFTFETVGDHPFFCRPHELMGMKGVITVVAPDTDVGADGG
jgi:plastocyanin